MRRFAAIALVLCAATAFAADEAESDAPTEPAPEEGSKPHIQVAASLFGELLGRSIGAELAGSYSLMPLLDLGLGLDVGSSPGILLTARAHLPFDGERTVRPFAQLRLAVHPASSGFGAGLFAGVLLEVGPGRVQVGAAGQLYAPSAGYLPGALMALAGYELDVLGARARAARPAPVEHASEVTPPVHVAGRLAPAGPTTLIRGKVQDSDGRPLTALVQLTRDGEARGTATANEFSFPVPAGSYLLTAEAEGYLSRGMPAQVAEGEKLAVKLALRLEPDRRTAVLTRDSVKLTQQIQFEPKASRILPASFPTLDEVVDILIRGPRIRQVRIEGHTDNAGGAAFAQNLSEERAAAVMQYLIERGVDPSRLRGEGFGLTRPVADNKTEEGRAKNRRVLFEIVEVGD